MRRAYLVLRRSLSFRQLSIAWNIGTTNVRTPTAVRHMGKAPIVTRPRSCGSKTQAKKHGRRSHFLGAALEIRESNSWPLEASQAARLGDIQKAELYFADTAATDLDDTSPGVAGGFRIAALGGLWQVAVFGFAGLSFVEDGMQLDPHLPPKLGPARVPVSVAAVPYSCRDRAADGLHQGKPRAGRCSQGVCQGRNLATGPALATSSPRLECGLPALPVVDELGRLVGIVSLTDARKLPQQAWPTTRVDQIMTPAPLTIVSPTDDVGGAIGLMAQKGVHQLPVVENGRVLGMLNREHVLRWIQLRHDLAPPSREAV